MKSLLGRALVVLAVSTAALHGQQSAAPYRLVPDWGVLPDGAKWGEVPGMAIDASGIIFAFHRSEPPIVELDGSGKILKMWGNKMFAWPHGIRVDRFGALWITDRRSPDGIGEQVFKFTRDGKLLMTLGTRGIRGESATTFGGPCDVAVAASGDIFVADGHFNSRIVKFARDGTFIKAWGKKGSGWHLHRSVDAVRNPERHVHRGRRHALRRRLQRQERRVRWQRQRRLAEIQDRRRGG